MNGNIQNGIILDGMVYELTECDPNIMGLVCRTCELNAKCRELMEETLCDLFGARGDSRIVFRRVRDNSEKQ